MLTLRVFSLLSIDVWKLYMPHYLVSLRPNMYRTASGEDPTYKGALAPALSRKPGREPAVYRIGYRHGSAQLPPPSLSARAHSTRDLAVSPLHPELSRHRGTPGRAGSRGGRASSGIVPIATTPSRRPAHGSGPMWIATPSP